MNFCLTPQRSQLTHIRTQSRVCSDSAASNEPRIPETEPETPTPEHGLA